MDSSTEPTEDAVDQPKESLPNDGYENNSSALDQADQSNMDSDESVKTITETDLPEEVTQAFKDSEFATSSIVKVYMLEGVAVDKLLQNNAEQMYAGQQNPDKIYQIQVKGDDAQNILYYNEDGDLLGSASI